MVTYDELFSTVESYDKINIQYLQFSKIGKVMRHITVLTDDKVPRDDEFKFRERAKALVDQWHQVLNANKSNGLGVGTNGKMGKEDDAAVVKGAAAIDLNGQSNECMLSSSPLEYVQRHIPCQLLRTPPLLTPTPMRSARYRWVTSP